MKTYAELLEELIFKYDWNKNMSQVEAIFITRILEILRDYEILKDVKK